MDQSMPTNKIHTETIPLEENKDTFDTVHLPIEDYRDWYDAILSDDVEHCEKILASHPNKLLLLNGQFQFESLKAFKFHDHLKKKPFQPTYPLMVAACYRSSGVLRKLIVDKTNLLVKEAQGMNVIHCLLRAAYEGIEEEGNLTEIFHILAQNEKIGDLLRDENQDGLRPLEMAACLGLLAFFQLIFNTPGIYKAREVPQGHVVYKWYDVTEYESYDANNRRDRSPVVFFRHLAVSDLDKLGTENNSSWIVIRQWIKNKVFANLPLVIIWFLLRFTFIITCFVFDVAEPRANTTSTNSTSVILHPCKSFYELFMVGNTLTALRMIIAVIALCTVTFDIIEYAISRLSSKVDLLIIKSRRASGIHVSVVHNTYFRIFHFLFCVGVVLCNFLELYYKSNNINVSWSIFFLFAAWSLLYFVQLLPSIGYLVVILERLMADTIHVMLIFAVFFMPFVHVFLKLHMRNNLCEIIRMDNLAYAMYDVFTVMLNMIAFKEGKSVNINFEIYGSHVIYVLIISTIVMNLIIALYSDTVAQLAPKRSIIMQLQKLSVMLILEKRLSWMLYWYYQRIQKYCYLVENGRIYLLDIQHSKKQVQAVETSENTDKQQKDS